MAQLNTSVLHASATQPCQQQQEQPTLRLLTLPLERLSGLLQLLLVPLLLPQQAAMRPSSSQVLRTVYYCCSSSMHSMAGACVAHRSVQQLLLQQGAQP